MTQQYSLYDDDGYVQQEGYCDTVADVQTLAAALGLRIHWDLTRTKYVDPELDIEVPRPRQESEPS